MKTMCKALCLLSIFSVCLALIPELLPVNDLYLLVGDLLNLTCYVPENVTPAPLKLGICRKGWDCSYDQQNNQLGKSISIIKHNVTVDDAGTYVCKWNDSYNNANYKIVTIGYAPTSPDVFCVSRDWIDMKCSVKLSSTDRHNPLRTHWTLFFSVDGGHLVNCLNVNKKEGDCTWPSAYDSSQTRDISEPFQPLSTYEIIVNVKNIAKSSNFSFIIDPKDIIKPSKVTDLRVNHIENRGVSLSWRQSPLIPVFGMQYHVVYHSQWDHHPQKAMVTVVNKELLSIELTDLIPYTNYTITVRCKPGQCDDRYWSEEELIEVRTDTDVPGVPRAITGGYFVPQQPSNANEFFLLLYLKSVPDRYKHSKEIYYQVTISNLIGTFEIVKEIHGSPITARIGIPDGSDTTNNLDITACNQEKGCSEVNKSLISIPPLSKRDTEYPLADDIVVESYEEGKYLISWVFRQAVKSLVKSIVYLWCRANDINERRCKSDLSWEETSVFQNHTLVLSPATSHFRDWIFGVAILADDGLSAGMSFSDCAFIVHGDMREPGKPTFNLLLVDGNYTKLVVSFTFSFCDSQFFKSKPMWYKIYYKETSKEHPLNNCTEDTNLKKVKASRSLRNITLHALRTGVDYSVCMVVVTRHETSEPSDTQFKTLADPSLSERTDHVMKIIWIAMGCFASLVILVAIIKFGCYKWNSFDDKIEDVYIPSNTKKLLPEDPNKDSGLPDSSHSSTTLSTSKCKELVENSDTVRQLSEDNHESNELQELSPANKSSIQQNVGGYVMTTLGSYQRLPQFETDGLHSSNFNDVTEGIDIENNIFNPTAEYSTKYGLISGSSRDSGSGGDDKDKQKFREHPYVLHNETHI